MKLYEKYLKHLFNCKEDENREMWFAKVYMLSMKIG